MAHDRPSKQALGTLKYLGLPGRGCFLAGLGGLLDSALASIVITWPTMSGRCWREPGGKGFLALPGPAQTKFDRLRWAEPYNLTDAGRLVSLEEAEEIAERAGRAFLLGDVLP